MIFQIDTLDEILHGLMVGVIASAPMGPVGVLCVQRTLNKGRQYGLVTGAAAAISDFLYALITGYGMSFVMDFIQNERTMFYLKLAGSVMLFAFGYITFRSHPEKDVRPTSKSKGTLLHNFVTGFLVTASNPLIIFLFIALFARFEFVVPESVPHSALLQTLGYVSLVAGAMLWWVVLTYIIDKLRAHFAVRGIWILNRVIGTVVIVASLLGFYFTVTGLYSLH